MSNDNDTYSYLSNLMPFATETESKYIEAIVHNQSIAETARQFGVHYTSVSKAVDRLKERATKRGFNPDYDLDHPIPQGYHLQKSSTLIRDPDPNSTKPLQWVSWSMDARKLEETCQAVIEGFKDDIPKASPVSTKKLNFDKLNQDWLNLYTLSDYHLGMYAWEEETGENWDINKAEDLLYRWIDYSVTNSPNTKNAVFAQLGDLLHWDGLDPVTPAHKNLLDADTRFQLVVRVAIRAMRYMVQRLLEKHEYVHLIIADANHDPSSGVWLREWFASLYDDEPRLSVDQSAGTYYAYDFGNTALFFHHGHKRRVKNIDTVFARQFRELYGRAMYCYGHIGHLHHKIVQESTLMVIEQHRTLSPKDAYAARGGYLSDRESQVITYSKKFGEVNRLPITPEMLLNEYDD